MNDPGLDEPIKEIADSTKHTFKKRLARNGNRPSPTVCEKLEAKKETHRSEGYFQPKRWWIASTVFPLIAGTFGPIANLMSVCALVHPWRLEIPPGGTETSAENVADPTWLLSVNAVSLAFAIVANLLLLLNFAHRVRYMVAQPLTIILWYLACFLLVALIIASHRHLRLPPKNHAFSQSFYYAIISAITYFVISTFLLWNFLGAYVFHQFPPSFTSLTISQRTLMLQTISYSIYLSIGAGVFSAIEGWAFVDGLYFADYTLLTIGLGTDFPLKKTLSKALLIPYAAGGIIMIGLIIGSLRALFLERGRTKIRCRALGKEREKILNSNDSSECSWEREFELMRGAQDKAEIARRWWGLGSSFVAFLVVWLGGALAFTLSERGPQGWDYFQALYFTYTSLLTIGYGDYYPQSNFGKPIFVLWSLIAIPAVTILISNMGDTVVGWVKESTLWIGQKTILPERREQFFESRAQVRREVDEEQGREADREYPARHGVRDDFLRLGHVVEESECKAEADEKDAKGKHYLGWQIAREINQLAQDIGATPPRKYEWEEWKRFLDLLGAKEGEEEWRWLGNDGPLLSGLTETEWVLAKMCERLEDLLVQEKEG